MREPTTRRTRPRLTPIAAILAVMLLIGATSCLPSGSPSSPVTAAPTTVAISTSKPAATSATTPTSGQATPVTSADLAHVKITLVPTFKNLDQPLYLTGAGDGSGDIFIVQKGGKILVARQDQIQSQPFLDITSRVRSSGSEQGLLGLAFSPNYKQNGYFYVDYIDQNGDTIITRFTAAADRKTADPSTFRKILGIQQPFSNHNGGQLTFGPDGMLWIGVGDGGSEGDPQKNGQNTDTLLGSILRIDVAHGDPYAIPPTNPFADGKGGKPEIWAYGLRNPWRFSFDRETHDLYIGDVGQNTYEEIDFVPSSLKPGLNFGWSQMEGLHCYPLGTSCDKSKYTPPVAEYSHADRNCAVTGGYVYRGNQFSSIQGVYFFTDYCSGTIWALTRDASGTWTQTQMAQGSSGYSSFGQDDTGELYVCDLGNGVVYHLTASSK